MTPEHYERLCYHFPWSEELPDNMIGHVYSYELYEWPCLDQDGNMAHLIDWFKFSQSDKRLPGGRSGWPTRPKHVIIKSPRFAGVTRTYPWP